MEAVSLQELDHEGFSIGRKRSGWLQCGREATGRFQTGEDMSYFMFLKDCAGCCIDHHWKQEIQFRSFWGRPARRKWWLGQGGGRENEEM